jgi:hypothetical protein
LVQRDDVVGVPVDAVLITLSHHRLHHGFIDIGQDDARARGLRAKLHHVFGRPGWSLAL